MTYKILFVIAHPDDESLWIGGTLSFLSQRPEVETYVICATGAQDQHRAQEFEAAINIAGVKNWFIGNEDIPKSGGIPLSDTTRALSNGINQFGIQMGDFDLIVTHSFYGDEHLHCQHSQLFQIMYEMSSTRLVPFGFFSTATVPYFKLQPVMLDMRRDGSTHIINNCYCEGNYRGLSPYKFYQFKIDSDTKSKMLKCYQSINEEEHQKGYASWDSDIESIYVLDARGAKPLDDICNNLHTPAGNGLFQ